MAAVTAASERPLHRIGRVGLVPLVLFGAVWASWDPITLLHYSAYALMGSWLVYRRPANVVSWLVLLISFGFPATTEPPDLDVAALVEGRGSLGDFIVPWVASWGWVATMVGFLALTILFPSGRLPAGRWRFAAAAAIAAGSAIGFLSAIQPQISVSDGPGGSVAVPNPFAVAPDLPLWQLWPEDYGVVPLVALLGGGTASMIVRYQRSAGTLRLQLRWLVAAFAFVVLAIAFGLVLIAVVGSAVFDVAWIPAILSFPSVPVAIAIAVLRYRLYEIDRIIGRTLGWAIVSGVLAVVFVVGVVALQAALSGFTQSDDTIAVAASTLLAFALFQPVRHSVQGAVDRRFDRSGYDATAVVEQFTGRLRGELDLGALGTEIERAAATTVRPTSVAVWLRAARERS